jgi:hypothetical protein
MEIFVLLVDSFIFRHTYNIAITDLYGLVMKGLIEIPMRESQDLDSGVQLGNVRKVNHLHN